MSGCLVPVLDNGHSISSLFRPVGVGRAYCNGKILINPRTGDIDTILVASRPIFARPGYEPAERKRRGGGPVGSPSPGYSPAKVRAAARAAKRVYELCACNEFRYFFTLTLSPEKIDRYDYKAIIERFRVWASNLVQRHGLRYVAVPEFHQDGAVHFHGLASGDLRLVDSGRKWRGKVVYNVASWRLGYTTAVELTGDYLAAARYVAKYVTKGRRLLGGRVVARRRVAVPPRRCRTYVLGRRRGCGPVGGRYYLHGGQLAGFACRHFDADGLPFSGRLVEVEGANLSLLYVDVREPNNLELLEKCYSKE